MTREKAKELLPVIQAFAEGKTIQGKIKGVEGGNWYDLNGSELHFDADFYRIKPEPRRFWIKFHSAGADVYNVNPCSVDGAIEVIEVLKD